MLLDLGFCENPSEDQTVRRNRSELDDPVEAVCVRKRAEINTTKENICG